MMNVLQIVQEATRRSGLPVPTSLVSSSDPGTIQLMSLFNELMQETVKAYRFQACIFHGQFTTTAVSLQGTIQGILGTDPESITGATMWDMTLRRPVFGPMDDTNFQILSALIPTGPIYQYRFEANNLLFLPPPPAGDTINFIYRSKNWLSLSGNPSTPGYFIQNDTDIPLIDDTTLIMGLKYRYKKEKNLPYAEDFETWQRMIDNIALRDGTKNVLYLDKPSAELVPGIFVPMGNLPLAGGM